MTEETTSVLPIDPVAPADPPPPVWTPQPAEPVTAHFVDARGVYQRSEVVDPNEPQPPGAIYAKLPAKKSGRTRTWIAEAWQQIATTDIPAPPEPAAAPDLVPQACTPAQGLVALYALKGITEDDLHAAIELIEDAQARYTARIGFARSTEWQRSSPTMTMLAGLLGLNDADLDALFTYAASVSV